MSFLENTKPVSVGRSYDRSSRSLDQDSPSKKRKFQTNYASATHLVAGKKVPSSLQTKPSDVETTVFYIPGVDVKVDARRRGGRARPLAAGPRSLARPSPAGVKRTVQRRSLTCPRSACENGQSQIATSVLTYSLNLA